MRTVLIIFLILMAIAGLMFFCQVGPVPEVAGAPFHAAAGFTSVLQSALSNPLVVAFGFLSICAIVDGIVKINKQGGGGRLMGKTGRETAERNESETREIQHLLRGFEKMEHRIEALETLLLERSGRD